MEIPQLLVVPFYISPFPFEYVSINPSDGGSLDLCDRNLKGLKWNLKGLKGPM